MADKINKKDAACFGTENVWHLLWRLAPPLMLSDFILAMYNICDSCFMGHYTADALTALSVIMPIQFLAFAFAVGTGIGVDTLMAKLYAEGKNERAYDTAGVGLLMAIIEWVCYSIGIYLFLPMFAHLCANSEASVQATITYGSIVCYGSLPMFLEGIWTKALQAGGNMTRPMCAQISGALLNIVLDAILIFGWWIFPRMGVAGAAWATVTGQTLAAVITYFGGYHPIPAFRKMRGIVMDILHYSYSQILRYGTMTFYIVILNMILAQFADAAVTVLGLYYKMQSFIFIPMGAFGTCIVPILSYNYTRRYYGRCKLVVKDSVLFSVAFMLFGVCLFEFMPDLVLTIFSDSAEVHRLGVPAFRIIGISLIPAVLSLISPIIFQAIGCSGISLFLSLLRQIFTLLPLFWILSFFGVGYTWIAFPLAESITGFVGYKLYCRQASFWK